MKKQPDDGLDAVHTHLAVAMQLPEQYGPWAIDCILAECPDPECMECGRIMCPHGEPLHFHHDGCPACCQDDSDED